MPSTYADVEAAKASPSVVAVGAPSATPVHRQYEDPEGFLGLHWRSIMIAVFVGTMTAVASGVVTAIVLERQGWRK